MCFCFFGLAWLWKLPECSHGFIFYVGEKPPDPAKENAGTVALQAQETMVDHCVSLCSFIEQDM